MRSILIVGEDALCCLLGARLTAYYLPDWKPVTEPLNKGGRSKLIADLPRYCRFAEKGTPVFCIADTDRGCAVTLLQQWLPRGAPPQLLLRLAVTEAESWLLADQEGLSTFGRIPRKTIPPNPDTLPDAKQRFMALMHRYGRREQRLDMVINRQTHLIQGTGYNAQLADFVRRQWQPERAATRSPSLQRAINRMCGLPLIQQGS
jgi:hypothetical protein